MEKYKILIVDDERPARKLLKLHLSKVPELVLVGTCENAMEAKRMLSIQEVDILLLDIKMGEITGLDLLKMLRKQPITILTTAYSEYALEGFELDVADYLVKPISFKRFFKSISKAMELATARQSLTASNSIAETQPVNHIFIKVESKLIKIDFDDLLYLESYGEYVKFYTLDKIWMTLKTLTFFEKKLLAHSFYRLQRSYIVNLNKIEVIEEGAVKIREKWISIGRKLRDNFMETLQNRGAL